MNKVTFTYSIDKDALSWAIIATDKDLWGLNWEQETAHIPKDLLKEIADLNVIEATSLVKIHLQQKNTTEVKKAAIRNQLIALQNTWMSLEQLYLSTLSRILNKPIIPQEFTCYLTTGFMCPYDEKEQWFMVSLWHNLSLSITTICHELLHFHFLYYFSAYLQKHELSNAQIETIKESLTCILNEPEFEQIIVIKDIGYPEHVELRKQLKIEWSKNKNFKTLLDYAISQV